MIILQVSFTGCCTICNDYFVYVTSQICLLHSFAIIRDEREIFLTWRSWYFRLYVQTKIEIFTESHLLTKHCTVGNDCAKSIWKCPFRSFCRKKHTLMSSNWVVHLFNQIFRIWFKNNAKHKLWHNFVYNYNLNCIFLTSVESLAELFSYYLFLQP